MKTIRIISACIFLALIPGMDGCKSAVKTTLQAASGIGDDARSIGEDAQSIDALVSDPPADVPATDEVVAWLGSIRSYVAKIYQKSLEVESRSAVIIEQVPNMEDTVPWWASLLGRIALAAVLIAVIVILWQTGVGIFIKSWLVRFGVYRPNKIMGPVKLQYEALKANPDSPEINASVAAARMNPLHNAAFKVVKKADEKQGE